MGGIYTRVAIKDLVVIRPCYPNLLVWVDGKEAELFPFPSVASACAMRVTSATWHVQSFILTSGDVTCTIIHTDVWWRDVNIHTDFWWRDMNNHTDLWWRKQSFVLTFGDVTWMTILTCGDVTWTIIRTDFWRRDMNNHTDLWRRDMNSHSYWLMQTFYTVESALDLCVRLNSDCDNIFSRRLWKTVGLGTS